MSSTRDDLPGPLPSSGQKMVDLHSCQEDAAFVGENGKISELADDLFGILRMQFKDPVTSWAMLSIEMGRRIAGQEEAALLVEAKTERERSGIVSSEQSIGGAMPSHSDLSASLRRPYTGFEVERETYDRIKPKLLETSEGKFVAIVGHEWVGPLDTDEEAERAGYQKFGLGPLYIKQVSPKEPPALVTRNVVICRT